MKSYVILLIIISALAIGCSQVNETSFREEVKGDSLFYYDENNAVRFKVPFIKGMKNGVAYIYDEKGELEKVATYLNDTIHGGVWEHYPSGIVKSEATYQNGKKFGNYAEFYDGYQDSTAVKIDGQWMIAAYPTKLKKYAFYDLEEKVVYFREYDIDGKLKDRKGRFFLAVFHKVIHARKGKKFSQGWITPDASVYRQINLKQFVVVSNLSDASIPRDTVYSNPDSTVTRWHSTISIPGDYQVQAISYVIENGRVETDTSNFKVVVQE